MSDILIKGVEMPIKCGGCPFNYREQSYNGKHCGVRDGDTLYDRTTYDTNHLCFITNEPIENNLRYKTRNENCPLIPVPEHGDLVQLDDALDCFSEDDVVARKALRKIPVVLERTT